MVREILESVGMRGSGYGSPMMHAVELENVTKTFGKHVAVDTLSLVVPQGSVYGFIGPNGSGKTTTMRMIMNILFDGTLASIQDQYGSDTIRIRTEDGVTAIGKLDGVEKINDFGKVQELQVSGNRDPQEIVAEIMLLTSFKCQ